MLRYLHKVLIISLFSLISFNGLIHAHDHLEENTENVCLVCHFVSITNLDVLDNDGFLIEIYIPSREEKRHELISSFDIENIYFANLMLRGPPLLS